MLRYPKKLVETASIFGADGSGTTQAKFVPSPIKDVSMTSRSTPFEKCSMAR
jgi:hypothetical protein